MNARGVVMPSGANKPMLRGMENLAFVNVPNHAPGPDGAAEKTGRERFFPRCPGGADIAEQAAGTAGGCPVLNRFMWFFTVFLSKLVKKSIFF